jgi:hypothetical protein
MSMPHCFSCATHAVSQLCCVGIPQFLGTYTHAGCKVVIDSEKYGTFIVEPTMVEVCVDSCLHTLLVLHVNVLTIRFAI